jgi:hypothetical protein
MDPDGLVTQTSKPKGCLSRRITWLTRFAAGKKAGDVIWMLKPSFQGLGARQIERLFQ